ncbi:rhamnan synthesis F family protein [Pokkaliibacter plantistimulans]|uniref:rhamnan synthesis F family protein n=1 Tax=Pokkaliibacter plantistimulans TaxID=1635171 RepID=UPI001A9C5894|nr:rhamnan synthesis F family protein [Pokkaliibacter plantistimulans]
MSRKVLEKKLKDYLRKRNPQALRFLVKVKQQWRKKKLQQQFKAIQVRSDAGDAALLDKATHDCLFDFEWYNSRSLHQFGDASSAFADYCRKSQYSNVSPSAKFDTEDYMRRNLDVYFSGIGALEHYLYAGQKEGREIHSVKPLWQPSQSLPIDLADNSYKNMQIALCLHIYYKDFIGRFATLLKSLPIKVDIYVSVAHPTWVEEVHSVFGRCPEAREIHCAVSTNRGRNFGPLLVEFSERLKHYDLVGHLHSKKSLYSGREQTQWSDYLNEYLLGDAGVIRGILQLFAHNDDLGMFFPTSYWLMPSWVNHWTMNKQAARHYLEKWNIALEEDFLAYPVGGMFWARPAALQQLFDQAWSYSDFPEEPLANDGSELHALERLLPLLVKHNGYKPFFYHPPTGQFTLDKGYIYTQYHQPLSEYANQLHNADIASFDLFDTLLQRRYYQPDYAKLKVGQLLFGAGIVPSAQQFVKERNQAEFECRQSRQFSGDVGLVEVYQHLAATIDLPAEPDAMAELEFEMDLEECQPKEEVLALFNSLIEGGKKVLLISDTYYSAAQIERLLYHIGARHPDQIWVSSENGLRKDNGSLWRELAGKTVDKGIKVAHIGDNVVADAQIPGDFGFQSLHILNPIDKWQAMGLPGGLAHDEMQEPEIKKWGRLICANGRYPLLKY